MPYGWTALCSDTAPLLLLSLSVRNGPLVRHLAPLHNKNVISVTFSA